MLISANIVLAVLSRGIVSKFVAVGSLYGISTWTLSVANQVTNMDDVCKFFDFVVFLRVFSF